MIDVDSLSKEERRLLLKKLLPQAVKDLSEDDEAASHWRDVEFDLEQLIPEIGDEYQQYFGEIVTTHKNRQGTPGHPKSFLAYITIPEAKLLRSLGLGYSYNPETDKWEQHLSRDGIPSFQGGDGGRSGSSSSGSSSSGSSSSGGGGGGGGGWGNSSGFGSGSLSGGYFGGNLSGIGSSTSIGISSGGGWGNNSGFGSESLSGGYFGGNLSGINTGGVNGGSSSINYNIPPAQEHKWNPDKLTFDTVTTHSWAETNRGMAISSVTQAPGLFGNSVSLTYTDNYQTVYGGALAAGLHGLGMTVLGALTATSMISAAAAVVLGAPVAAIAPMAKALALQGVISQEVSSALQAVGRVAAFFQGTINNMQALDGIMAAREYGAISPVATALLGAAILGSQYNIMSSLRNDMESLGYAPTVGDLDAFGFSRNADGTESLGGWVVTLDSLTDDEIASFIAFVNRPSKIRTDFDSFEWMAGGILLNNYMAGGNMFHSFADVGLNWLAAVGEKISMNKFVEASLMGEDIISNDFVFNQMEAHQKSSGTRGKTLDRYTGVPLVDLAKWSPTGMKTGTFSDTKGTFYYTGTLSQNSTVYFKQDNYWFSNKGQVMGWA